MLVTMRAKMLITSVQDLRLGAGSLQPVGQCQSWLLPSADQPVAFSWLHLRMTDGMKLPVTLLRVMLGDGDLFSLRFLKLPAVSDCCWANIQKLYSFRWMGSLASSSSCFGEHIYYDYDVSLGLPIVGCQEGHGRKLTGVSPRRGQRCSSRPEFDIALSKLRAPKGSLAQEAAHSILVPPASMMIFHSLNQSSQLPTIERCSFPISRRRS